jgi:hypothetical protein
MSFGVTSKDVARTYDGQPRSPFDITFPSGILWGMVGCASAFSLAMVSERRRGTWQRLRTAPINPAQILAGKGLACFLACLVDIALLLAIGVGIFHVHVGSPFLLVAASLGIAVLFVGVTMLVSVIGSTEAAVSGAGWAIFILMMMFVRHPARCRDGAVQCGMGDPAPHGSMNPGGLAWHALPVRPVCHGHGTATCRNRVTVSDIQGTCIA